MLTRTTNPNHPQYKDYGGRGIKLCEEWLGTEGKLNFISWALANGYVEGLTIDRKDVDGDYSPANCRWVDMKTQDNNRRSNKVYTYDGKTMTASQWSRYLGGSKDMVRERLKLGWSEEEALSTLAKQKR
jgi:hypothetical protein